MFPVQSAASRRSRLLLPVLLFVALAWCALCGVWASASAALGHWSPPSTNPAFTFAEVHMVLLPGDGSPYDSRILMWGPLGHGAEVGWNDGAVGCGTFPYTLPVLSATWTPEVDIHCAGHAQLANGELLSAGGEDLGAFWGIDDSRTFQTGTLGSAGTWTGPPSRPLMQQARFYPSVTTLSDGRAVVTGGYRDEQAWFFGGRVDGNPPGTGVGDSLFRHARSSGGRWDPLVRPLATAAQAERPTPREGLTSVYLSDLSAAPPPSGWANARRRLQISVGQAGTGSRLSDPCAAQRAHRHRSISNGDDCLRRYVDRRTGTLAPLQRQFRPEMALASRHRHGHIRHRPHRPLRARRGLSAERPSNDRLRRFRRPGWHADR